jgi:hypothetical protein
LKKFNNGLLTNAKGINVLKIKIKTKSLFLTLNISLSLLVVSSVYALDFASLSDRDASSGLKAALEKGAIVATSKLGKTDGYLKNNTVKIQLPLILEKARPILKMTGKGAQLDDLVVSMNRAAESAVLMAKPLLLNAVSAMSITDAKNILTGGDTSVTDYFRQKTSEQLSIKFLPIVKGVTDKSRLSSKYNSVMGQAKNLGAVAANEATVEGYVTLKAVDGLYLIIAEEEKKIRQDPIGTGSEIIGKVFGLIK